VAKTEQIVLFQGFGYSGKAARIRALSPTESDAVTLEASKRAGVEAAAFRLMQVHIGVCRMLQAVTKGEVPFIDKPILGDDGAPLLNEDKTPKTVRVPDDKWLDSPANWTPVDRLSIEQPGGYEAFIDNAKDDALLGDAWSALHEVGAGDLNRIMGKARRVSTG
jgi:hypothetical protein